MISPLDALKSAVDRLTLPPDEDPELTDRACGYSDEELAAAPAVDLEPVDEETE